MMLSGYFFVLYFLGFYFEMGFIFLVYGFYSLVSDFTSFISFCSFNPLDSFITSLPS